MKKELLKQFQIEAGGSHYPSINPHMQEQLAKLIVQECVRVVENLSPGYDDYRNQIEDAFRRDCVQEIKQHFGVE
jgi:hypothetical protein